MIATSVSAEAQAPVTASGPGLFWAEVERELGAMRSTAYRRDTVVDEASGRFEYNCSGFINYALRRALPEAYEGLVAATHPRPRASDMVAAFSVPGPLWRKVLISEVDRGDVIAWERPEALSSRHTGHVVVVAGKADRRSDGEWVVPVVDASESPHGRKDSRHGSGATGLGTGAIVLLSSGEHVTGYRWSTWADSPRYLTRVVLVRFTK